MRVVIADDDPLVRRVIKDALHAAGLVVVGDGGLGSDAVSLALHHRPDVLLLDLVMPQVDGAVTIKRITSAAPSVAVIVMTPTRDDAVGLEGLLAGAAGYVTKDVELDALPPIVEAVHRGEIVTSRRFVGVLVDHLRALPGPALGVRPVRSPLTAREWEVLDLLCAGYSTDAIAETLVLATETVRSHIKHVLRKLDVRSRGEAVELARRMRLPLSLAL